jgi:hypothetical protein
MRPPENEPSPEELQHLLDEEERGILKRADVPDDVKSEVSERLERSDEDDLEEELEDETPPDRRWS